MIGKQDELMNTNNRGKQRPLTSRREATGNGSNRSNLPGSKYGCLADRDAQGIRQRERTRKRTLNEPDTARNEPGTTGANQRIVGRERSNSERSHNRCGNRKQPGKRGCKLVINQNWGGRRVLIGQKTAGINVLVRQRRFAAVRPLNHRRPGSGCRVWQVNHTGIGAVFFGQQQRFCMAAHLTPMINRAKTHAAQQNQSGQPATDKTGQQRVFHWIYYLPLQTYGLSNPEQLQDYGSALQNL